jgi:hypothetical protein
MIQQDLQCICRRKDLHHFWHLISKHSACRNTDQQPSPEPDYNPHLAYVNLTSTPPFLDP